MAGTRVDIFDNYEIAVRQPFGKYWDGVIVMGTGAWT
jgi:hypothetical protein